MSGVSCLSDLSCARCLDSLYVPGTVAPRSFEMIRDKYIPVLCEKCGTLNYIYQQIEYFSIPAPKASQDRVDTYREQTKDQPHVPKTTQVTKNRPRQARYSTKRGSTEAPAS